MTETEFFEVFQIWRSAGIEPLSCIRGYADLLLKGQVGELSEQQRQFIQVMRDAVAKAVLAWKSPENYLTLQFALEKLRWEWEPVQLSQVIDNELSSSFSYVDESDVSVYLPEHLPPVKASRNWLGLAIMYLLAPAPGFGYSQNYPNTITANQTDEFTISVQIGSGLILDVEDKDIALVLYPGHSLNVADIVLKKHGSYLEIHQMRQADEYLDRGTEFKFSLPIWSEG